MPVAVQCTSGHEVVQQVRPTGEPDETTSGLVVPPSSFPISFHVDCASLFLSLYLLLLGITDAQIAINIIFQEEIKKLTIYLL